MDYEKKYKEAIERAKASYENSHGMILTKWLEGIFPELAESKDKKIRKAILIYLDWLDGRKDYAPKGEYSIRDMIAWLEKRGEQKLAAKVEPKFKVGDFIVNDYCMGKVIGLTNDAYLLDTGQGIPFSCEYNAHLWTIQDAKDGDVLVDGNLPFLFKKIDANKYSYAYCGISGYNDFKIEPDGKFGEWTWVQDIKPATKEHRDLLFAKMKEAGYEWNAEKKELKKIEQKPVI